MAFNTPFTSAADTLRWAKIVKTYADFIPTPDGLTNTISIFNLPAKAVLHDIKAIVSVAFAGPTSYTVSVGKTGQPAQYIAASDVKTAGTLNSSLTAGILENTSATTTITATATSVGGNLGTATQGTIEFYILYSLLP